MDYQKSEYGVNSIYQLSVAEHNAGFLTGTELQNFSDHELDLQLPKTSVFARVSPEQKFQIVKAWKRVGSVVAMTGDGVNDAPAVKEADIGIAMGKTGTDVTKSASDMVLADDNFSTIVAAVEEGRGIYSNIKNIVQFLLSANSGEILYIFITTLIGWPTPLLPLQILWMNLVTDSFPALALASEKTSKTVMQSPPRKANEPLFTKENMIRTLFHGFLLALVSIVGFWWSYYSNELTKGNLSHAQAVGFCICVISQLLYAFACRSEKETIFQLGLFSNRPLFFGVGVALILQLSVVLIGDFQLIFFKEPVQIDWLTWVGIVGMSFVPLMVVELKKFSRRTL